MTPLAPPDRQRHALFLALIAAAGVAAYANSFVVPFQFDDLEAIVRNPSASSVAAFLSSPSRGRPVAYLSFAINGSLGGGSVAGFHVVNLAIHLATAAGVYALALLLSRLASRAPAASVSSRRAGLLAALLFVTHPLHTQAVTYLTQRMASLAALLFVGAVLAYLEAASARAPWRRRGLLALSLSAALLAYLTKENTVVLPAVLLLAELLLLDGDLRARALRLSPQIGLPLLVIQLQRGGGGGAAAAVAATAGGALLEWTPAPGLSPQLSYLLAQPAVLLRYLGLLILPVGLNLDRDLHVPASPFAPSFLLPLAALLLLAGAAAWWGWRRRGRDPLALLVPFAAGWFLLTLTVESSVIPLADLMFEHRAYLPSVAIFPVLALHAERWMDGIATPSRRSIAWAAAGAVVLALGVGTVARNHVWRSPEALWTDVLEKSPGKARPYVQLAQAAEERGAHPEAIALLESAARLERQVPHVHLLLGLAYRSAGDLASAERALRRQQALGFADFPGSHLALGLVLLETGRQRDACAEFGAEVEHNPRELDALENVGSCRYAEGDLRGAVTAWSRVAEARPGQAPVLYNLAMGHAALGALAQARAAYERFLRVAGPELEPQRRAALAWLAANPR